MINAYVGITDRQWFDLLQSQTSLDEVNFWQPSGKRRFQALRIGELFLFKLHSPHNFIVGGGIFSHFSLLPISLAWEVFGIGNGARNLLEMRQRVEKYRRVQPSIFEDYTLGCILLEEPFFFEKKDWIPIPADWSPNIVQGKTYDLSVEPGRSLWRQIATRKVAKEYQVHEETAYYGEPVLVKPRLGQGGFRILVTDGYARRCAFTGERTLPALDAAHIMPFSHAREHSVNNGLLLRKDLHALFDRGYLTVAPDYRIEVSKRIKEEFENGRDYYRLHGSSMRMPVDSAMKPDTTVLTWHNELVFRG
jgi:putative restriction endonuclease